MTARQRASIWRSSVVLSVLQLWMITPLWGQKAPLAIRPPALLHYAAPAYPAESQSAGRRATVVLELDVAVNGTVSKVKVLQSSSVEFHAAAVAAARRLRFSPARRAGVAIAVRIRFQYRFEPDAGLERRGRARGLGSYSRRGWERAPSGFESLRGRVLERGTGRPVVAATVLIPGLQRETLTDIEGRFAFGLLKNGRWKLQINGAEHRPVTKTVQIRQGKTTTQVFRTNRRSYVMYKATAVAPAQPGEMARRSLTAGEIQRIPGVYGDAFKVVQNLPGVARAPAISGQIIVRGSAPGDTQINIEGVRVPLLYHFGGLYSVVNTDILEGIDFFPGGYSVRYGRKTGGLLQARLKLAKDNAKWRGYVETNVFHTGLFLSGPLSEDIQLSFAARRSYIDVILNNALPEGTLPFTVAPRYWDYQLKLDWRISAKMDATALILGSDDSLAAIIDRPPPGFGQANTAALFNTNFHGGLILLRMRGEGWRGRTTLGLIRVGANVDLLGDFRFDVTNWQTTLRQDFEFGEGPLQLRTGLDMFVDPFRASVLLPPQAADLGEGAEAQAGSRLLNQRATAVQPAIWFDTVFRLRPDLEVVPGVRLDLFRGQNSGQTWLPRINVRWRANPNWTLKAASGVLSQPPAVSDVVDRFGNPQLKPFYSWESALGVEGKIFDRLTLDLQVFHKQLWDMIVDPRTPWEGLGNVNAGRGRIVGMELLLRHPPVGRFFGWIAYTLMRGTVQPHPDLKRRLLDWDQTHILTAVGSYKLPYNMELSARFRLVSGNPYTGLASAVYKEDQDDWDRISSACVNCARFPAFHQLDVRFDKKFIYDRWMLSVYLDIQNFYNRANPESVNYNYDYTRRAYQSLLPFIPSLGIRGEF